MDEQEYLENRVEDQIKWYSVKSSSNKKWYQSLRVIEIATATAIPFLAGVIIEASANKITLAFLGLLVAVVAGLLSLFKFQELWIEYRTTAESLKHEKFLFATKTEPYNIEGSFPLLVQNVEALISKEHTSWKRHAERPEKQGRGAK